MKRAKIGLMVIMLFVLIISGCFNEQKTDKGIGVKLIRNGSTVEVLSEEKFMGTEISINRKLSENEIEAKRGVSLIIKNEENKTIVAAVKVNSEIQVGESLFFIKSENLVEAALINSVDKNKIDSAKNIARATGNNILLGDFNKDNIVNMLDFAMFKEMYGKATPTILDLSLYDIAPSQKGVEIGWTAIYSQKNGDNKINIIDFVIFALNFMKETPKVITPTSISISGNATIDKDSSSLLTATVTYSDTTTNTTGVSWISSDTSIATVDINGNVRGLKAGLVTITASKGTVSKSIEITVKDIITTFSGIKVHFKKPSAWTGVFIHYWTTVGATATAWASCPAMTDEGNGWFSYTIDGATSTNVLFKDKTGETSTKTADQTGIKSGEHWFDGTVWTDTDPTDNIPPTVSIQNPVANATITGKIEVTANAQDNNAIDKVDFYLGVKLIGTSKVSPYSIQWDSAYSTNGAGELKAVAFDKAGNSTTSSAVKITLSNANIAPVAVAVDNLVALAGTEVEFDASGSYDNGQITSYVWDNGLTGVKAKKLYSTVGNFVVKLTVTDDGGLTSTTSINVNIVDKIAHRDFREETVYFMMTDRFADGNKTNNNIWGDEYLPGGESQLYNYDEDKSGLLSYYHGGDFDGIIKNLDYIKDMGFTAIWITPVVKQPEGRRINTGGTYSASAFHGYWAYDFDKIDPHLTGSGKDSDGWADFDKLVAALHANGMKLMLDIVVNHGHPGDSVKGSTSKWADKWNKIIMDGQTWTFDKTVDPLVDPSNPQTGFFGYAGTGNTWLIDLLDFNGNGPASNNAMPHLKNVYKKFIDHGVDAFRIDTVAYMSRNNWADFTDEMYNYAKSKGNDHFYMIGEAWTGDRAGTNNAIDLIYGGQHFNMLDLHNASMDFPGWLSGAFEGRYGFENQQVQKIYGADGDLSGKYDPTYLGTFVDNHDVFRANGKLNETQYKNNLNYIFLFRGVPIVYYGTEAMYSWPKVPVTTNKEDVCARWMLGDEGINYVKTNKPTMYKHIKMLNSLRRDSEVLRKGQQTNLVFTGNKAVIKREYNSSVAYIGMSIGAAFTETVSGLQDGTYTKYIPDSANGTFTKTTINVSGGTATLDVPANSFVIIQK